MPLIKRFAAVGCIHCNDQDDEAVEWAAEIVAKHQPDFMGVGGDLLEATAASMHDLGEEDRPLGSEFAAAGTVLAKFRKASKRSAVRFVIPGNHDENLLTEGRIPKNVRGLCNWRDKKNIPEIEHWKTDVAEYEYSREGESGSSAGGPSETGRFFN